MLGLDSRVSDWISRYGSTTHPNWRVLMKPDTPSPGREHFLVERYVLFTHDPSGRSSKLFSGQVHHVPYPVRPARVLECQDSLVQAAGIEVSGPPEHVAFCEGVEVEIFGLEPLVA